MSLLIDDVCNVAFQVTNSLLKAGILKDGQEDVFANEFICKYVPLAVRYEITQAELFDLTNKIIINSLKGANWLVR